MKFTIENLGPIRKTEMEFGDLTILCGKNNMGKTYITYNTFNFFDAIRYFSRVDVEKSYSEMLLKKGKIDIDLSAFYAAYPEKFKSAMDRWVKTEAWRQMASHKDYYGRTAMDLDFEMDDFKKYVKGLEFAGNPPITRECVLHIQKKRDDNIVNFILENKGEELPDVNVLQAHLGGFLSFTFNSYFPDTFIITCERTGVACFRPSFLYTPKDPVLRKSDYDEDAPRYPRPMQKDWRFVVEFKDARIDKSFIAEEHPEILEFFEEICGGGYSLDEDTVLFSPKDFSNVRLTITECSSSVRSLMELNFYLKHKAKKRQILIIDEPELNLHPENQRKMARLLAMLVNAGLYVAITTHSDYIIRELNTLIMLHDDTDPRLQKIADRMKYVTKDLKDKTGYRDCLLDPARVKCYVTKDGTIEPMDVNTKYGIEVTSFDDSIREVNHLQREILYGE